MITLNGAQVDETDPCALWTALYAIKLKLVAGENVEETHIQSPVSKEMVRFSPGNLGALNLELQRLQAACDLKTNGKRARFAGRFRHTPRY